MIDVIHYTDLKSPYAYLAFDAVLALRDDFDINLITLPYTLRIEDFMGSVAARDPHQWRKVKYSYMDCRRQAKSRGLKLYGPKKIYDTRAVNTAMLYAGEAGRQDVFCRDCFKRFFEHDIDVENPGDVAAALERAGVDAGGFAEYLAGRGGARHDEIRAEAETRGVFGVPMLVIADELFWGGDRLEMARRRLAEVS